MLGATLLLAACGGDIVPRGRVARASRPAPAASPPRAPAQSLSFTQCEEKLTTQAVAYTPLPDRDFGGGCSIVNSVKLLDIGVPTTNLGAMTCGLAANFAAWAHYAVQPAARLVLGAEVVRIDTYGTYNCRSIAGSDRLSEHARGNAVDVAAFVLSDGRRISVEQGWRGDDRTRRFLQLIHDSACKRFNTVLSPDYNAAHANHLHFDMGGKAGFCR